MRNYLWMSVNDFFSQQLLDNTLYQVWRQGMPELIHYELGLGVGLFN